ncbi:MAG TPA: hypothetical protein VF595_02470 [Tepidisphaeraceae bacterium]
MLALTKHHAEHKLTRRRVLKRHVWKLQGIDLTVVDEPDDSPGVERIAGETIRMPRKDAGRLTAFDAFKHGIEHRPTRHFSRLLLNEFVDNGQTLLSRHFAKLRKLIADRSNLTRHVIG